MTEKKSKDEMNHNVIAVRCTVTKNKFLTVRREDETLKTLKTRYAYGIRVGNTETVVCSMRQHGLENHTFKIVATFATRQMAIEHKVELLRKERRSLNSNMPAFSGLRMVANEKAGYFPDEALGRHSQAYLAMNGEDDEGDEEGQDMA